MVPPNKSELLPIKLLVDFCLHPLGSLCARVLGGCEAGEGVGDGQVVRVGVPLASQVSAHLLQGEVGVQVKDEHGRGGHRHCERLHLPFGSKGF